jgi:DNA-binding HxlR family transcriptional regulator
MTAPEKKPWLSPDRTRIVLGLVGDKWSLLVVCNLKEGPRRFTELKRAVDGISQRMLTVTLRGLERDGLLTRTIRQVMPPHVTYELTGTGKTLSEAAMPLLEWTAENLPDIDEARTRFDSLQDRT